MSSKTKPYLKHSSISLNERTIIRTIVKWSKPAVILAVVSVLLAAFVFVKIAHAKSMDEVKSSLSQSQQEVSKTKSHLEDIKSENQELEKSVEVKDEKIDQLKKENARLKG